MTTQVWVDGTAVDRLAELGLSVEIIERAVRRADAEASMCTLLDPPIMGGLTRWGRATRFLREELIPLGWQYDNPRNLSRTIHPSGAFAIVVSTGDELTGLAELLPATKYLRGHATTRAVAVNQLTLDFGGFSEDFDDDQATDDRDLLTWFLLFHFDQEGFRVELSLPSAIVDGRITDWAERIIIPSFPRDDDQLVLAGGPSNGDQDDGIVVEVTRR